MKISLNHKDIIFFQSLILKEYGIISNEADKAIIEEKLSRLILEENCKSFKEFYLKLKSDFSSDLKNKIINLVSNLDTSWFRDVETWTFFRERVLPIYIDDLRKKKKENIIIWSAGVSTGQEAYSIAMLIDETIKKEPKINPKQFFILGIDISPSALFLASSGRYSQKMMSEGILKGYAEKHFTKNDNVFEIKPEIKKLVYFMNFDLQNDFKDLPIFDVIFCRNVISTFSKDLQIQICKKLSEKLDKNGYLFIGKDEALENISNDLERFDFQNVSYYKQKNKP